MDLKGAADKYKRIAEGMPAFNQGFLNEMGTLLINLLKEATPVDTGELRRAWEKGDIQTGGTVYYLPIVNTKEYASYVEDGRRQNKRFLPGSFRGGKFVYNPEAEGGIMLSNRWVEGKHMYRISSTKIKERLPAIYENEFLKYMNSFSGDE